MHWLLLAYRIPREPTAGRVFVWRKLKQLGAVAIQDAVWVLPANPRTQEQFQWLAAEIIELGGEALLFSSQLILGRENESLRAEFEQPLRQQYQSILDALKGRKFDLKALSKKYVEARSRDYFQCELGERVRKRLLDGTGGKSK